MTLKVYVIGDVHSPDVFQLSELSPKEFDLVITLGDISPETMDYILYMTRFVPSYGVLGNHDPKNIAGLNDLHGKVVDFKGIKIGGCGGAPKYKNHPNHYTEKDVEKTLKKILAVDLFISHAPPLATSQNEDPIHKGFKTFDDYMNRAKPKYWLHGHLEKKYTQLVGQTTVMGITDRQPMVLEF